MFWFLYVSYLPHPGPSLAFLAMPEGDTIRWHAGRIRPALEGRAPEAVRTHPRFAGDRWVQRLTGRTVQRVDAYGKHLMVRFDGDLVLHSHLGMVGSWGVYAPGRRWPRSPRRAWLVMRVEGVDVVQFDGSTLELLTAGRTRFDQRLAGLGPDILADDFDEAEFLRRLRGDDPTRPIGDALLDQRTVAGIGNMWKAEGCWDAEVDPWRADPRGERRGGSARSSPSCVRAWTDSATERPARRFDPRVYGRAGRPCSALRRDRAPPRPGGGQPHAPTGVRDASAEHRRGCAASGTRAPTCIAPGNTAAELRRRAGRRRGHDRVRCPRSRATDGRELLLAHDYEDAEGRTTLTLAQGLAHLGHAAL